MDRTAEGSPTCASSSTVHWIASNRNMDIRMNLSDKPVRPSEKQPTNFLVACMKEK
jgi:hypothetical protein